MRVTTKMMTADVAAQLLKQSEALHKSQKKVATGKNYQRISDDPIAMGNILDFRKILSSLQQYRQNIGGGKTRLATGETVLDSAYESVQIARNIAVEHAAGSFDLRPEAAEQIANIREELRSLANSKLRSRYLFSGHQTDTAPFAHRVEISGGVPADIEFGLAADATDAVVQIYGAGGTLLRTLNLGDGITPGSGGTVGINSVAWNGLDNGGAAIADGEYTFTVTAADLGVGVVDYETYNGDAGDFRLIVGEGLEMDLTADGSRIFSDLFYQLGRLQQALQDPNASAATAQIAALIDPLNKGSEQMEQARARAAIQYQRLETFDNQTAQLQLRVEEMRSKLADADMAQAIVELQSLETAYETTLATAARILQPSLIQFLK